MAGGNGWGIPDPDWPDGPLDGRKITPAEMTEGSQPVRSPVKNGKLQPEMV